VDKNGTGLVCLLEYQAAECTAILGCDRPSLSYSGLKALVYAIHRVLLGAGLRRGDRVALVVSNGPHAATSFISIAAGHICAPLNPAYRAAEFEFYLLDLKPKALILEANLENAAADVALKLGIPVFYLHPARDGAAGTFTLETGAAAVAQTDFGADDEVALLLHTSGTTSRPKIVPLTHANLLENAHNIAASLELAPHDRCLNVMPLFHVHGLIGACLSSLSAGASVFCSPGFQAARFFSWLDETSPTWFTAVPTMHQAILARAAQSRDVIARSRLRLIRSCSSALAPQVLAELENAFHVPAVEAYGMTEASHQIACNPISPGSRKPGSVGIATGPDVAIMGPGGDLLPAGLSGEIVIRGANVTHGYDHNPEANASAFSSGWFRTGDQGYLDSDRFLFINGRTKEMINRGGEKIAPREIDEALMDHPAVQQAVAFALPDQRLGEDVGAAVVLNAGASVAESELQQFVAARLAEFKVPRKIVFVTEIPKGPTGKVQRIGLAEKLNIASTPAPEAPKEFAAPRNKTEQHLLSIWRQVLGIETVGVHDCFFDLGGDSSAAAQILVRIEQDFGKKLSMTSFLCAPAIAPLADLLQQPVVKRPRVSAIRATGTGSPFFCVHGLSLFWKLAQHAPRNGPFLALEPPEIEDLPLPLTLENLAAWHVRSIREIQPAGPYYLGGWCNDGVVAFEIAQQLRRAGDEVRGLMLFDSWNPQVAGLPASQGGRPSWWARVQYHQARMRCIPAREWFRYLAQRWTTLAIYFKRGAWQLGYSLHLLNDRRVSSVVRDTEQVFARASATYAPSRYDGTVTLIRAGDRPRSLAEDNTGGWKSVVKDLVVHEVPGTHRTMFLPPNVEILSSILCEMMDGDMSHALTPRLETTSHARG
jgi:acyl-CoA synthetase (AMP-forming)/AMP-acid ligase II/thioesterase domain-containing protein/acyl carrier protein